MVDAMGAANRIRRVGFRKWYERELLGCHANLVLVLLATVALLGCLEVYSARLNWIDGIQMLAGALASAAIGYFALRRYLRALAHAEYVASQAACATCTAYAKWEPLDEPAGPDRLRVRCRRCEHRWEIRL